MLPISAGVLHRITGVGPTGLIAGEQIFVVMTLVGSTFCSRGSSAAPAPGC